jgi:hypothetical protein
MVSPFFPVRGFSSTGSPCVPHGSFLLLGGRTSRCWSCTSGALAGSSRAVAANDALAERVRHIVTDLDAIVLRGGEVDLLEEDWRIAATCMRSTAWTLSGSTARRRSRAAVLQQTSRSEGESFIVARDEEVPVAVAKYPIRIDFCEQMLQ